MNNIVISNRDLKPIWIYFIGLFCSVSFFAIVFKILGLKDDYINLYQIICEGIIFVIFLLLYKKRLKSDLKRLTKKDIIFILIAAVILIGANELLSRVFEQLNVNMNNQNTLIDLFSKHKIMTSLLIVLFGPMVEEVVFRYSFSTFIKSDILFLIISSLAFGIIHGVGIVTILYVLIGFGLGLVYLKTNKNIVASTTIHMLNNLVSLIMMFLMLK